MLTRALSAIVGIVLFLILCFAGLEPFALGVAALTAIAAYEFTTAYGRWATEMSPTSPTVPFQVRLNALLTWLGVLYPLGVYFMLNRWQQFAERPSRVLALLMVLLVVLFIGVVRRAARTGQALGEARALHGVIGMAYIGLLFSSFILLRGLPGQVTVAPFSPAPGGAWLMLFVAVCVWATDTFAYLIGRTVGKHKLAPRLSPGKTVEGALGGLLGAVCAGMAFGHWIHLSLATGLAVGAIAGTVGQIGDLFESALKRELGIKDFGRLLPGHGGVLDRFDSLLFVAPCAFLYLVLAA